MEKSTLKKHHLPWREPLRQFALGVLATLVLSVPAAFGANTIPPDAEYSQPRLNQLSQGYDITNPGLFTWQNVIPNALASYFTFVPYSTADATALGFPATCGAAGPGGEDCYTITVKRFPQALALPPGWGFGGPGLVSDLGASTTTDVYGYGSGGTNWTPPQFVYGAGNSISRNPTPVTVTKGNAPALFATANPALVPPIAGDGIWHFPAPSIKGTKGRPIRIQWLNELPNTIIPGHDPSLDCTSNSPSCFPYNRIVTHVHGAHVGPASDGLALADYNPDFSNLGKKFSQTVLGPGAGPPGTYVYPMDQEAATIWYHDHAAGSTHLNTNQGMAGFFPITDDNEKCLQGIVHATLCPTPTKVLPTGTQASGFTDSAYELGFALQDRVFYPNGNFAMPDAPIIDGKFPLCDPASAASRLATCSPLFMYVKHAANASSLTTAGIHLVPYDETTLDMSIPENSQAPVLATSSTLEFFGNMPVVNGVVYGKYNVEQRVYRMRFIGGTDSRTWDLQLQAYNAAGASLGIIPFYQIGSEQGFLNAPVLRNDMLLLPGERLDVLVDFKHFPTATKVILNNLATDAPYQGELLTPFNRSLDIPEIMAFAVSAIGATADVPSPALITSLQPTPIASLTATSGLPIRKVGLEEIVDEYERIMPTIDRRGYDAPYMQATEVVRLNDTEIWDIINTTADAHPMHLHLVAFQVVHRQPFTSFTPAVNDVASGVFSQPNYTVDNLLGPAVPPDPHDAGWKDTVYAPPGFVTRVIAKFDKQGEYVWHCHILSHEEHDMMRPMQVVASYLNPPAALTVPLTTLGNRLTTVSVALPAIANTVPVKYYVEYQRAGDTNWTTVLASGTSQSITFPSDGIFSLRVKAVDAAGSPTFADSPYTPGSNTILVGPDDQITSPANNAVLGSAAQTFTFSTSGAYAHYLWVGTTPGASDLGRYTAAAGVSSINATGLPINGSTIYVRLWVKVVSGTSTEMRFRDYVYTAALGLTLTPNKTSPQLPNTAGGVTFNAVGQGGSGSYQFEFWVHNGTNWSNVQPYSTTSSWNWDTTTAIVGALYTIQVNMRNVGSSAPYEAYSAVNYRIVAATAASGATLTPTKSSPQPQNTPGGVTFDATGLGGSGSYEFEFWRHNGTSWSLIQPYSITSSYNWDTMTATPGTVYTYQVNVRNAGSTAALEAYQAINYIVTAGPATGATLTPSKISPQPLATAGTITFTATGQGGSGSYEFEFWLHDGTSWALQRGYSPTATWDWNAGAGSTGVVYTMQVNIRNAGSTDAFQSYKGLNFILN